MASYQNPKATNSILDDINEIREINKYNAKLNPSLGEGLESGMIRLVDVSGGQQLQIYNGSSWANLTASKKLINNVDTVDGYHTSTSAVKNTIPIYNSSAKLVGSITGNAVTATALQNARTIDIGGIAASTATSFDGKKNITIPINSLTVNNDTDTAINGVLTTAHGGTGRTDGASLDVVVESLAGQVKASAYGQIGRAKQITSSTDFNTLVVDGNYTGYTSVTVADNNAPDKYTNASLYIRVSTYGNTIHQVLYVGGVLQWNRTSANGGASWAGWTSIGSTKDTVTIYVSKSGSDSNTGYDSAYPVATIARAIQIAKGAMPRASNGSVKLCVGEGEWGSVTFEKLPFRVDIYPFSGSAATEYSTSLPVFTDITAYNTKINVWSIVARSVNARSIGHLYVGPGYKKLSKIEASTGGVAEIGSQNAATNVLEIFNSDITNPVFFVFQRGSIIIGDYQHILLSDNINRIFMYATHQSSINMYSARITFDSTDAVNSGKKFSCYGGAYIDTAQIGSSTLPTFLTSTLPGTGYSIENGAIINGIPYGTAWDADVLHLSGGTMTGTILTTANAVIRRKGSDGFLQFGMETLLNGGRLNLFGKDYSTAQYAGGFELTTGNGTNTKALLGKTNGDLSWSGSSLSVNDGVIYTRSIELSMNTPYIDFHYGSTTTNYTSRIIESASGVLSVNGVKFQSNKFTAYANSVIETSSSPTLSLRSTGSDGHKKTIRASTNGNLDFGNENLTSGGCYIPSTYMSSEGTWNAIAVFSGGKLIYPNGTQIWVA